MLRKVKTEEGIVQGLVGKDPRITVFRGVPYAKPPMGELRWKAPQPAEKWEGVRKCYEYGDMPMMRVHPGTDDSFYKRELHPVSADFGMSEDCLYLNIFSPAEQADEKLPVFCYIHGGGLQDGYNYEVEFDGERVARRGVIVVMISYRLGLFGFLAHPEITAETGENEVISNFGMQDQSMALHWIARNIENFGGDPYKIVICGQSAGAGSVQTQLCSPINRGIIAGAICQSAVSFCFGDEGVPVGGMTLSEAEKYGSDFFQKIGVKDLKEARAMDAAELTKTDAFNRFLGASRGFCELRSGIGKKVYYYIFDPDIPGDDAGSFHGSDLWFTFDSLGNSWRPFEGRHYDLARQICSYWTNFVKTGDPNGLDYNGNPLPEWKPYNTQEKNVMKFLDISRPDKLEDCPVADFRLAFGKQTLTDNK